MSGGLAARNRRRYALLPLSFLLWPVARAVPRRPGLWVFAFIFGYADNPRYLFEHVVEASPAGVRPVWFAQTRAEAAAVRATGRAAVWKRSPRAWWLQLRAGVIVLGNGPSEVNRPLMGRALVVQTWHGAPFKRIHADFAQQDVLLGGSGRLARLLDGVVKRATNAARQVDLVPSQSPVVATRFQSAFRVGPDVTPVVGTPRADVILRTGPDAEREAAAVRAQVLPRELQGAARLVLYAPTWRDGRDESFLSEGFDAEALDGVLGAHDAVMVMRLHPQMNADAFRDAGVARARRIVLGTAGGVDVNVLLRAVDVLVTDYSAISVDYAALLRPIVYLMPDLEAYEAGRGTYEPPSAMTGGLHVESWAALVPALEQAFTEPGPYVAAASDVADRYVAHRDTRSCERITAEVLRRTGLAGSAAPRR